MERSTIRVVLYFAKDHPISKYPNKERSRVAKDWIEQALKQEMVLGEIQNGIEDIKGMLSNGIAGVSEYSINTELSAMDIDLIDQMLGLK